MQYSKSSALPIKDRAVQSEVYNNFT